MKIIDSIGVQIPQVLLPRKGTDLTKWAVIACDQFTSQPEYWEQAAKLVGDAPSTLNRLLSMGVEPFLVTAAVNLIVAQRLVRVICKNCKEEHIVPAKTLIDIGMAREEDVDVKLYRGHGCNRCNGTGYKGRLALFEVLPMSDEIKECVLSGFTANEIQREAMRLGMQTLRQSGVKKLLEGITTVEEVLRVTK